MASKDQVWNSSYSNFFQESISLKGGEKLGDVDDWEPEMIPPILPLTNTVHFTDDEDWDSEDVKKNAEKRMEFDRDEWRAEVSGENDGFPKCLEPRGHGESMFFQYPYHQCLSQTSIQRPIALAKKRYQVFNIGLSHYSKGRRPRPPGPDQEAMEICDRLANVSLKSEGLQDEISRRGRKRNSSSRCPLVDDAGRGKMNDLSYDDGIVYEKYAYVLSPNSSLL